MILGIPRPIPVPNVAAADRYPLQLDEALAILDGRHLHIDKLKELGTHQLCCFHTLSISRKHAEPTQRVALCARNCYTIRYGWTLSTSAWRAGWLDQQGAARLGLQPVNT